MRMKDAYIDAHERLIAEYMDEHPDADESVVYDQLADKAWDAMRERMADRIDEERMRRKEFGNG